MATEAVTFPATARRPWAGIIVSALPLIFLLMDAAGKLAKPAVVVETTLQLGYQDGVIIPLGVLLLECTILYVVPKTSVLGAILLTGYLGGGAPRTYGSGARSLHINCFRCILASLFG
jgi:hypothetical protein